MKKTVLLLVTLTMLSSNKAYAENDALKGAVAICIIAAVGGYYYGIPYFTQSNNQAATGNDPQKNPLLDLNDHHDKQELIPHDNNSDNSEEKSDKFVSNEKLPQDFSLLDLPEQPTTPLTNNPSITPVHIKQPQTDGQKLRELLTRFHNEAAY